MIRRAFLPWRSGRTALALGLALSTGLLLAGCGTGNDLLNEDEPDHLDRPLVVQFSPTYSPIDFATLQQNPTYTDGKLTLGTNSNYPGEVVVFFQNHCRNPNTGLIEDDCEYTDNNGTVKALDRGTIIDPATVFIGGDPSLGLDPSAIQLTQSIPGTGNVLVALREAIVEVDRIRLRPARLWKVDAGAVVPDNNGFLDNGQYSIGVFGKIANIQGRGLMQGPVFHSFTVGSTDTVNPFVVATNPLNNQANVGAGVPPPTPDGAADVADIRTNIFGATSPSVIIRFNEGIRSSTINANTVSVVDSGAFVPGGGVPPQIPPAPGYPRLKSLDDGTTLPSNGFEIVWKGDPRFGAFPFGTTIDVTIIGAFDTQIELDAGNPQDAGTWKHPSPIRDLADSPALPGGNPMLLSYKFSFRTLAPPKLPANPFPEYAVYWSASDRVGVLDTVNFAHIADTFTGAYTARIIPNVLPDHTDEIATAKNMPGFDPGEIVVDGRTNFATCHTYIYVISPATSEVVIINTRTSLPVAIIKTPNPGGITHQTGGGQAANVVCVTNASANTLTVFDVGSIQTGLGYLNGPIRVQKVTTTGNTPRAIAMTGTPTQDLASWNRDAGLTGPGTAMLMYVDYTDGAVKTKNLASAGPIKEFKLGPNSSPNDVAFTPCFAPCQGCPLIMYAAITTAGTSPLEGKVSYYVAGPGCQTGGTTPNRPDAIIGDRGGLDAPAGITEIFSVSFATIVFPNMFAVAESGSQANGVTVFNTVVGNPNVPLAPEIVSQFHNLGANPKALTHRSPYVPILCMGIAGSATCYAPPPPAGCVYKAVEMALVNASLDGTFGVCQDLYVCCAGEGFVRVINANSGLPDIDGVVPIPGVRFVASHPSQ